MVGTIRSTIGTDHTDMVGIIVGIIHIIGDGVVVIRTTITITTITTIIMAITITTIILITAHLTTTLLMQARVVWVTRATTTTAQVRL